MSGDLANPPAETPSSDELKQFVECIERRLEQEKQAIADDIKDVFAEMSGLGFDTEVVRQILRFRKQDRSRREERAATLDVYMRALEMA